jgi:hypothetical protein
MKLKVMNFNTQSNNSVPDFYFTSLKKQLDKFKNKKIIFVLENPILDIDPRNCRLSYRLINLSDKSKCFIDIQKDKKLFSDYKKRLNELAFNYKNVKIFDSREAICNSENCSIVHNGNDLYGDKEHLSAYGSFLQGRFISKYFQDKD